MPFEIRRGERVRGAIKRMARAELQDAEAALVDGETPLGERVHQLRTATKKVRALTRLVRPAVGRPARRADRRLGELARAVSDLRDAEVILGTFDQLRALLSLPNGPSIAAAQAQLAARLRAQARALATPRRLTTIGKGLRRERKRLARWLPRGDGWWVLGSGVCAGYKRARRRMAAAYETPSGLTFHAWRRAVKAHRFQVRVLRQVWPAELSARVEQLQRLGELLGQEHDLTVLAQTLADERSCFADDRDCARILALLERRRGELRAQARPLGERLFAERPRDLRRRLGHYLRAFRAEPPGTAASTLRDASADRRPRANGSPAVGAPI